MNVSAGTHIGPYEILAPLGAGGMGEVYRARDERLGRSVALKVLSTDLAASGEHLRRFEQEARAASALNHPNIITIYDIGRADSLAYIAMELIDGRDVRTLLAGEQLAPKQALRIAVKVADGLAAAHERGIVHRDLKPENLMVSRDGFVKILDFGLAKLVRPFGETDTTLPHTSPGAVFGTVGYMSPEQAAGRAVDYRSDQFALGVILYEMLTGRLPFSAATAAETLAAIIRNEPKPITEYNQDVPEELARVVERLLSKDPNDRYTSTRDLTRDLREIRDRVTSGSDARHRTAPPAMRSRRARWAAAAGAVGLLAVLGVALMVQWRDDAPPPVTGPQKVAIVPFTDRTGSPEGQIFVDGLTEMIAARIPQSSALQVIPVFEAGAAGRDPAAIARRRGAAMAVHGSIQRSGEQVRVNFSVIKAADGGQVAANTITGSAANLFGLQDQVVDAILTALKIQKTPDDERSVPVELTSAEDQNAYVEALGLLQRSQDLQSVDRAIEMLTRLLPNARDSAPLNSQLARAYLNKAGLERRSGLIPQATIYAERAVEIDPSHPETHVRLGQVRLAASKHEAAEEEFRRALTLRPNQPDAVLGLGATYEAMGRAADAERMYKQAISLRPDHANSLNRYAVFLFNIGRYEEAAANYRRFTELLPTARGFSNLGEVYQALGRYDDAQRAHERSIALEPTTDGYIGLGNVFYYTGRNPEACRAYQQAADIAPTNYNAWTHLGDACRWTPEMRDNAPAAYEKGLKSASETLAVNPGDAVAYAMSAICMAKLGRLGEATAASTSALKIDPTRREVLYAAAVVALLRGNADETLTWLERAVDAGYPTHDLQRDPEFRSMQKNPAFRKALEKRK